MVGEYAKVSGDLAASPVGESVLTPSEWKVAVASQPANQLHTWRRYLLPLQCGAMTGEPGNDALASVWLKGARGMTEGRAGRRKMQHEVRYIENCKRRYTAGADA